MQSIALAIGTNVGWRPEAQPLDVKVLLYLLHVVSLFGVEISRPHEERNDLVAWDLNANADWWPQPEVLDILGIEILELAQVEDEEPDLHHVGKEALRLRVLENHNHLVPLWNRLDLLRRKRRVNNRRRESDLRRQELGQVR